MRFLWTASGLKWEFRPLGRRGTAEMSRQHRAAENFLPDFPNPLRAQAFQAFDFRARSSPNPLTVNSDRIDSDGGESSVGFDRGYPCRPCERACMQPTLAETCQRELRKVAVQHRMPDGIILRRKKSFKMAKAAPVMTGVLRTISSRHIVAISWRAAKFPMGDPPWGQRLSHISRSLLSRLPLLPPMGGLEDHDM